MWKSRNLAEGAQVRAGGSVTSIFPPILRLGAILGALFLVSALVLTGSRGAFSATTSNPDNAFTAGTIALTDDDGGTAMFTVTAMEPGDTAEGCITVTYTGTADPLLVKIYQNAYSEADGAADGATLDDAVSLDIDRVDDCTAKNKDADLVVGTISANAAYTNYSNGLSTGWDPAGNSNESFLFTATFVSGGSDNLRIGDSVTNLIFTWETQTS